MGGITAGCRPRWRGASNSTSGGRILNYRLLFVLSMLVCLAVGPATIASAQTSQATSVEQTVWNLERDYWRYVQENDLKDYTELWHKDFLGWPSVSVVPVGKDHITDWIISQTSQGLTFKSGEFKPAKMRVTGDVAMAYYWMTFRWVDRDGKGDEHTIRVTHTWVRDGKSWQILGGMSSAMSSTPQK